ncbi:MAG: hypothetical protein H8E17_07550 [Deltaproteobacteria bacterium]|nr:hypothetical protein [Deltaproteobacteria bacterium]
MAQYSIKFISVQAPTDDDELDRLSIDMTQKFGSQGWRLASACFLPQGSLLLGFEKEER